MGNSITCAMNCNYRVAATLYTLETWFFQVYNCKYLTQRRYQTTTTTTTTTRVIIYTTDFIHKKLLYMTA
jgi:hypothetical protein